MQKEDDQEREPTRFEKEQLKMARKTLRTTRATAVIALMTCIVIVIFNYLSQMATRESIEISSRSLELAHRPYLSISFAGFELREPLRRNLFLKLNLKNVGSVPANILNIEFKPNEYLERGVDEQSIFRPRIVYPGEPRRFEVDLTFTDFPITKKGTEPGFEITAEYCGPDSSLARYISYGKYSIDNWGEVMYINGDSAFAN